jgi:hypothetical protein
MVFRGRALQPGIRQLILNGAHRFAFIRLRMHAFRNIMPGFVRRPISEPPAELDWEMFQGPPRTAVLLYRGI